MVEGCLLEQLPSLPLWFEPRLRRQSCKMVGDLLRTGFVETVFIQCYSLAPVALGDIKTTG
jgi:hypothetical protein